MDVFRSKYRLPIYEKNRMYGIHRTCGIEKVGATGFEPATSRPPAERATKLRHTPVNSGSIADVSQFVKRKFKKNEKI